MFVELKHFALNNLIKPPSQIMTIDNPIPTAEKHVNVAILIEGVKYIGRPQIAKDYDLHPSKAHRLLTDSDLVPVLYLNRHFYAEPAVRAHFGSLEFKQPTRAAERTK
jgi:hypothetical protein